MGFYFEDEKSAAVKCGGDIRKIIRLAGQRFMEDNPPEPYVWRTFDTRGIGADRKGRYLFDFDARFPDAEAGRTAIACADLYCPREKGSRFNLGCTCPASVWLNGEKVFTSSGADERSGEAQTFSVSLKAGYNRFVITVEKTVIGFSAFLQNAMPQWEPCNYYMPFDERNGEAGFLWRLCEKGETIPPADALRGDHEEGEWLPRKESVPLNEEGIFASLALSGGREITVTGTLAEIRAAFAALPDACPPVPVKGRCTPYLVLGPLSGKDVHIAPPGRVTHDGEDILVWRPDMEGMALRPYVESFLFGKWKYPLGVTLYGMLESAKLLSDEKMADYVKQHVLQVTGIQEYAEYDTECFGFAGVNQQICWLDALDDCGSFGSLMLQFDKEGKNADISRLADRIARYMLEEQVREEHGAFCRRDRTIWADDMYMSVPFLCRYAERTGDTACLDAAGEQLLLYRKLLFMPEKGMMAHMCCMIHDRNNGIPWSRGNGWVIFALSELLMRLPAGHRLRQELISFFRELTEGYLRVQGESGLWHQILDDPESYPESSATAMMICAFCRGIRGGWYDDGLSCRATRAAEKGWMGLTETAMDEGGNLFGVCRGSGFSFSRNYYRSLSWNYNDTHGIGIVMLAGCEMARTVSCMAEH
ncbi:MAG: hypothetical protein CW338_07370 [Clostridiales bacterium]|nr:hypothetical protein [Clostridiales bacterium]